MTDELVPSVPTDATAPLVDGTRQRAEMRAVKWLHGYTSANTRNGYAFDLGISATLRAALPGGPTNPTPPAGWAWIPWACAHGIDPAGELTAEMVEAWVHTLRDTTTSKNVLRRRFGALCAYYRSLRRAGATRSDPNDLLNRRTMGLTGRDPSHTLPLTPQQIRGLFVAAQIASGPARVRHAAMLSVLAATGCRAGELVSLTLTDYRRQDDRSGMLLLDGKGGKRRWTRLPAADAVLVDRYLEVRVAPDSGRVIAIVGQVSNRHHQAPLFTTLKGRRVHEDNVVGMLRGLCRVPRPDDPREQVRAAARLLAPIADSIHPHQFRHAYAQNAEQNGVPVSQIQADLGHASLATTQTYLHAGAVAASSASQVVSDLYHVGLPDLAPTTTRPTETP